MKTFKYLMVGVLTIPAVAGTGFAQTPKPATPPAATAAEPAPKATAPRSVAGELVGIDHTAKTVTVKHVVDQKPAQITFSVEEAAAASLAQLKPGDHVKVTYVEMGDKRIAKNIVKG